MIPSAERLTLLLLLALAACQPRQAARPRCAPGTDSLVAAHLRRYPALDLADALKLLQQATLGSEHAVSDATAAAAWLEREWAALGEGPGEPLVDTLGEGGAYARVHLRPWREAGGSPAALLAAFVRTAREAPGDTAALECALAGLELLAGRGAAPWPADSVRARRAAWAAQGYPAMHHSDGYRARYRPAYRVVAVRLLPVTPRLQAAERGR